MGDICEVDFRKERHQRIRRILGRSIRNALNNEIEGFALVAWDSRGDCYSSYLCDSGPIGRELLPTFVERRLSRHVTVNVTEDQRTSIITGGK